jgi:hypothetical protein
MWYLLGNIPSGTYSSTRLAKLSPGYTAVDSSVGYTYLNPQTGRELSAVAGFTYNGMNDALQYRSGIDFHVDWAAAAAECSCYPLLSLAGVGRSTHRKLTWLVEVSTGSA